MRALMLPLLAALLLASGCAPKTSPQSGGKGGLPTENRTTQPAQPKLRVSDRPGNTAGVVFIAMYHRVMEPESPFVRTKANFLKDLKRLYDMGFRPVLLTDYLDNKMDLAPGASPVVMTWDDSTANQFSYLPDGTLDPTCAIAIWQSFAKDHPDFPVKGSFYVNANGPFIKDGPKKIKQLLDWGCEVDSHTMTHPQLSKLTDEGVMKELAGMQDYLRERGIANPRVLCLPFGIRPKNRGLMKSFVYNGKTYKHDAALLVGADPAPSPNDRKRDPYALPRIQAYDGPYGLTYWLDLVEKGKVHPYVQP